MRTCAVDGCSAKHFARGWCSPHYSHWRYHGDPVVKRVVHREPESLLCTCPAPLGSPDRAFGQCFRCYRKPAAWMACNQVGAGAPRLPIDVAPQPLSALGDLERVAS